METKDIRQEVFFKAKPKEVYDALMDSKTHAKFTDSPAKIGKKEGDKFSAFDGYATGENLTLKEGKLIVQTWRASDWPEGYYSKISFEFTGEKNGTKLVFKQTGIPKDKVKDIGKGWEDYYWTPMKSMFDKK
ncbi:Activator of Hsp90 ATPase -like protein [Candidatus Tiddalikarchaeum anstoanum]|nr:Activator of Hsp90 ATPase -like protein [Candidatus Tiddalikarchaeum anstoanum]